MGSWGGRVFGLGRGGLGLRSATSQVHRDCGAGAQVHSLSARARAPPPHPTPTPLQVSVKPRPPAPPAAGLGPTSTRWPTRTTPSCWAWSAWTTSCLARRWAGRRATNACVARDERVRWVHASACRGGGFRIECSPTPPSHPPGADAGAPQHRQPAQEHGAQGGGLGCRGADGCQACLLVVVRAVVYGRGAQAERASS